MKTSLRKQTLLLTAANGITRGMGFLLRLLLARRMGAEALGVMELAGSVSMLALTPVTAGLPTAVSRLSARRRGEARDAVLHAARAMVWRLSLLLVPLLLFLSPLLSRLVGDRRTLPAIWAAAPAIPLLGLCGVYSGFCFGTDRPHIPAAAECAEQTLRLALCALLLSMFSSGHAAVTAALPGVAEAVAAAGVCALFWVWVRPSSPRKGPERSLMQTLLHLCAPMVAARLCATGMRMLSAVLLPHCLRMSGLSHSDATAQYGLFCGMAMPLTMLPGIVTGALCTVSTPAVSRLEGSSSLRRLVRRLLLWACGIGLLSAAGLYVLAGPVGTVLYHQPALPPLVRALCPLALFASVRQVQFGVVAGLGLQGKALGGTLFSSAITLVLTALWSQDASLRLFGASAAAIAGQLAAVVWNGLLLRSAIRRQAA